MTVPPITSDTGPLGPADVGEHLASTDWRHGGGTAPPADAGAAGRREPFLPQEVLSRVGLSMLVLGLLVVAIGSYAVAIGDNRDVQLAIVLAAGIGGLTIAVVGGFLYAGSWLATIAEDKRAADRRLAETLLTLADVTAQAQGCSTDLGALSVVVGDGTVLHRRDCPLVAYRPDLVPADRDDEELVRCRVCAA